MNLHEYQAKALLRQYNVAVPDGYVAFNAEEAVEAADQLGVNKWVVKAQVHAGGRGKAGGVKIVDTKEALKDAVNGMLGRRLVTFQTDEKGQPVNSVLVEEPSNIAPSAKKSSSTADVSNVTCCILPRGSVKRRSRNLTSLSLICFRTSLALIFISLLHG